MTAADIAIVPPPATGHLPPAVPAAPALDAEEREIPVADIDPPEDNPRKHFDQDGLQALCDSIAAIGLQKPITVYYGPQTKRYGILGGVRRFRSHLILGRKTIRARVLKPPPDPAKRAELMLIDNDQEDLDEIERGLAYLDYTARYQCTASALAKKLGKTAVSSITRPMQLARKLTPQIHDLIRDGKLPPFAARPLVRLTADEQLRWAQLYIDRKVKTAAELAAAIKNGTNGTASAPAGSFTCEESGCRIAVTLPPGGDLGAAAAALKIVLEDLRKHSHRGLEHWKTFLTRKARFARKAAEMKAAQDELAGHVSQTPERSSPDA